MDFNFPDSWRLMVKKVLTWLEDIVMMFPNVVAAIVILVLFVVLGRLAQRIVRGFLHRTNRFHNLPVITFLSNLTTTVIILTGTFIALGILNLDKTVTSLLAGVGVIGLALSFAFQDIAANLMSGIFIIFRRPFKEGDVLEISGKTGKVQAITIHSTILHSAEGQEILIPNRDVFKGAIVNYSQLGYRLIVIQIGLKQPLAHPEHALSVLRAAIEPLHVVLQEKGVETAVLQISAAVISAEVRFWVHFPHQNSNTTETQDRMYALARSEALLAIKKALEENNIALN